MPKYTNRLKHTSHYENVPFEVPEGWCWCRLGDIEEINLGFTYKPDYVEEGVYFLSVKDITSGNIDFTNARKVSFDTYNNASYGSKPQKGDILYGRVGTIGNPVVIDTDEPFCIFVSLGFFRDHTNLINKEYVCNWMNSLLFKQYVEDKVKGSTLKNLNTAWLKDFLVPLPPVQEQSRIVQAINQWEHLVNLLENEKSSFVSSISIAKSKILDLAIHGKLVPQDANDEPASELLKRINPKAVASCDNPHYENVPFEIPDNWAWVRIDEINKFKSKSVNPQNYPTDQFELFSVPTFETGEPEFPFGKEVASSKVEVEESDVLLCKINPHLNRVWVVRRKMAQLKSLASSEWIVIRTEEIMAEYLALTMQSPYFRELMMSNVSGVGGSLMRAQPTFVKQYMIPIPPVSEQSRIVTKAREFFKTLDSIAESLN